MLRARGANAVCDLLDRKYGKPELQGERLLGAKE